MKQKAAFKQFLRSLPALSIHTLCIGGAIALCIGLLEGNAPPDALAGLGFLVAVYPVLLALAWWQFTDDSTLVVIDDTDFNDARINESDG